MWRILAAEIVSIGVCPGADPHPDRGRSEGLARYLSTILAAAAETGTEEEKSEARAIIEELTDGKIELVQMGEQSHRGWLQGRIRVPLVAVLVGRAIGRSRPVGGEACDITIDYKWPVKFEAQADEAWVMYLADALEVDIATELG